MCCIFCVFCVGKKMILCGGIVWKIFWMWRFEMKIVDVVLLNDLIRVIVGF